MTDTWLDPEERAYPRGGFTRRGRARLRKNSTDPFPPDLPYGQTRVVRASIPDTYFSIPARLRFAGRTVKGFLTLDNGEWQFTPDVATFKVED